MALGSLTIWLMLAWSSSVPTKRDKLIYIIMSCFNLDSNIRLMNMIHLNYTNIHCENFTLKKKKYKSIKFIPRIVVYHLTLNWSSNKDFNEQEANIKNFAHIKNQPLEEEWSKVKNKIIGISCKWSSSKYISKRIRNATIFLKWYGATLKRQIYCNILKK